MPLSQSPEAKQPISNADDLIYIAFFQPLDKTALNAEKLDAAYVKYASFLKQLRKTNHFT